MQRILILFLVLLINNLYAQVTVRDHRKNPGPVVIGPSTRPFPTDGGGSNQETGPVPPGIDQFPAAAWRTQLNLPVDNAVLEGSDKLFFVNTLRLENGLFSSRSSAPARELLFFADTLDLYGSFSFRLNLNNENRNGFLFIACRVLKLRGPSMLYIDLGTGMGLYRQAVFMAEQILMNGNKVYDKAAALDKRILRREQPVYHWERAKVGEPEQKDLPPGFQARPGFRVVATRPALTVAIGSVGDAMGPGSPFYYSFSKWLQLSYNDIYSNLLRNYSNADKLPFVREFIRFRALNNYGNPHQAFSMAIQTAIRNINEQKDKFFKGDFAFERNLDAADSRVTVIASVREDYIHNYLLPERFLVNPINTGDKTLLGYLIFDESKPSVFYVEVDATLQPPEQKRLGVAALLNAGEIVHKDAGEIDLSALTVEGDGLIGNETTVTRLNNNMVRIRFAVDAGNKLFFGKLFSPLTSGYYLQAKWQASRASDINGLLRIPISFAYSSLNPVKLQNDSLINTFSWPVTSNYYVLKDKPVFLPDALRIPGRSALPSGLPAGAVITEQSVYAALDVERYGDYFDQIDGHDNYVQELQVQNFITPQAADSLSGSLQYVELDLAFQVNSERTYKKRIRLSPYRSEGDHTKIRILKAKIEEAPVTISGKAYYENGEYDIPPVKLGEGDASFNLTDKYMVNKK